VCYHNSVALCKNLSKAYLSASGYHSDWLPWHLGTIVAVSHGV